MLLWDQIVDLFRVMIVAYAQACGGNLGAGITAFSVTLRILMFPITLRIAQASMVHQQALQKLQPELEKIRRRFRKHPERIAEESHKLFQQHGLSPIPYAGCLGSLAQMPLFLAVYSAVRQLAAAGGRFLWIRNIARPDLVLTAIVTALTYASIAYSTSNTPQQGKQIMVLLPVIVTAFVLAKTSAGLALYWGISATASLIQSIVVRRYAVPEPAS